MPTRSRPSPRDDVVRRLRQLEAVAARHARRTEVESFGELAELLAALAVSVEACAEPAEWLFAVSVLSRQRAEARVLRRLRRRAAVPPNDPDSRENRG